MSRHREDLSVAPNRVVCASSTGQEVISSIGTPTTVFKVDNWRGSVMDDVVTPHGVDREFNGITHEKYVSAVFGSPTFCVTYSPPTPSMTTQYQGCAARLASPPTSGLPAPNYDDLLSQLADQLDARINEGSMALVTLCELGKTVRMVRNPFNLLRPTWRRKFGRTLSASSLLKKPSDYWLEWTYGWKAAYMDVKAAAKTTARLLANSSKLQRGFSRLTVQETASTSWATPIYETGKDLSSWETARARMKSGGTIGGLTQHLRASNGEVVRTVRLGCWQELARIQHMTSFVRFLNAYGVGSVSQVVDTLWEVIPYSFVIDWFLDWHAIADIPLLGRLRSADVRHLGTSERLTSSYDVEILNDQARNVYYMAGPWYYRYPTGSTGEPVAKGRAYSTYYTRTAGGPGISQIAAGLLGSGLSSTRGISGLSLIVQRLLR